MSDVILVLIVRASKSWSSLIILLVFALSLLNLASAQNSGIKEISENQFVDELGYVHVLGEIQNSLTSEMEFVKVNVAYYDSQNKIIGSDFVYSDPHDLGPEQSATYQAMTSSSSLASTDVSSVKVNYEYQVNGIDYQSPGQGNRPITSNGQPSAEQNDLSSNTPIGPNDLTSNAPSGPINPDCGRVIHGIYNLTSDFNCIGDGLIVGGDDNVIYLNGHSINGPGDNSAKVGIAVPHSNNVKIKGPGTIENFQAGVLMSRSSSTEVSGITFEGNKISVFMTGSSDSNIHENAIAFNAIGVASHSSNRLHIGSNNMTDNILAGITSVNTQFSLLDSNSINGSKNGIYLDSQSSRNRVVNNTLANNIDLNNADGLDLRLNQNQFVGNNCLVSNPFSICNTQATDSGTTNTRPSSAHPQGNCPPMSLVLCEGPPRCPNGYHRSPDGDCEPARD
jgi:copper-binding protein NosD